MAAAVPFAIKAGTMIGGSLLGKKLSGPSKQQSAATAGTGAAQQQLLGASQPLLNTGADLTQQGAGSLSKATNYYGQILGNRGSMREALAPETATALDYYKGAEGKANRTMVGGARDNAVAELEREKVGKMALMLPKARAAAAQGITQAGGEQLQGGAQASGQGVNAAYGAAQTGNALYDQASKTSAQQAEGGKVMGKFLYDVAGAPLADKFGKKKTSPTASPVATPPPATPSTFLRPATQPASPWSKVPIQ